MASKAWHQAVVSPYAPISEALRVIDDVSLQICLVVDAEGCLVGTVTDGDVRRGLLRSVALEAPVSEIMTKSPTIGHPGESKERLLEVMTARHLRHMPIVDSERKIVGLVLRDDLLMHEPRLNTVVLMAGGLGTRLRPMTETTPKPLLNVGGRPILETILESFIEHRFEKFFISVNYKSEMIKAHFGDGKRWNVEIRYLEEKEKLGTAGALSLIEERHDQPLIVMNGDLLTRVNYSHLLQFHTSYEAHATMCVREYDFEVPFGVVTVNENRIERIVEKPVHSFFVNAGIYVIDPETLTLVQSNQRLDMPELFDRVMENGLNAVAFPIREYWLDIGRSNDFERANGEIDKAFRD
jgi:dTDP-glucose pyrophosphorylase